MTLLKIISVGVLNISFEFFDFFYFIYLFIFLYGGVKSLLRKSDELFEHGNVFIFKVQCFNCTVLKNVLLIADEFGEWKNYN